MRFDLEARDPDALKNKNAKQQKGQAVREANDAARRHTTKRRYSRSVAAAGQSGKEMMLASTIVARLTSPLKLTRQFDNYERCVCVIHGPKQRYCP